MNLKSISKAVLACFVVVATTAAISSCKKNDTDKNGSANVKIVNASPGSSAQSFYLADKTVVSGGLTFGQASNYIAANSGNNLTAQFKNEGSTAVYASDNFGLDNGGNYTIFLAGTGQSARVMHFKDDLTPVSGQAKVRFIHLSDAAPNNIDIRRASGDNLATNLARNSASNYLNVAPGLLSIRVYDTGQSTSLGNFDLTTLAGGKIYTIFITGSTANNIAVNQITHN